MPAPAPQPPRHAFRFTLPPSLGADKAADFAPRLERFLARALGRKCEVVVSGSYEALAKDLLTGRTDAAWAPPFVCARVEAMGVRVAVRGVRKGASTYRAALISRAGAGLDLTKLDRTRVLWVDRDSVGGYLLPMAFLRNKGLEPARLFATQDFAGSYRDAVEGLLAGKADLASVFAPPPRMGAADGTTGVDEILPGRARETEVIAFTDEAPNDGVAVAMATPPDVSLALEKALLALHESLDGAALLKDIFNAERFEAAPRLGYRALYRVALASL